MIAHVATIRGIVAKLLPAEGLPNSIKDGEAMSAAMFAAVKEMKLEIADLKARVAALEQNLLPFTDAVAISSPFVAPTKADSAAKPVLSLKKG